MMRALLTALAVSLASPVWAAQCAPREAVIERLADRYSETRQGVGLGSKGTMIEIFANSENGTWTILVTSANGISCLVASGSAFEWINSPAIADGDNL